MLAMSDDQPSFPPNTSRRHRADPVERSRSSSSPATKAAPDDRCESNRHCPMLLWSPDSKKIATFQQDQRGVGEMYLVETKVGHPALRAWKYPLPGDDVVTTIQRVTIDLDGPRVVRLQLPPDQHRSTLCDNDTCRGGEWADVQWDKEGSKLAFVSTSRD